MGTIAGSCPSRRHSFSPATVCCSTPRPTRTTPTGPNRPRLRRRFCRADRFQGLSVLVQLLAHSSFPSSVAPCSFVTIERFNSPNQNQFGSLDFPNGERTSEIGTEEDGTK